MSNWWKIIHSTPHAISQYKSQAKRKQKATGLTVIKISDNHWKVGKWDVFGNTDKSCISSDDDSLQCNCPDKTSQETPRSWVGSGAGGFNPCKHVYAVLLKEEKNIGKKKAKVTLPDGNILIFEDTPVRIECSTGDCDSVKIRYTIYRPWDGNVDTSTEEVWTSRNHYFKIIPEFDQHTIWIASPNDICGPPSILLGWYFPEGFSAESEIIEEAGNKTLTIYGANNAVLHQQSYINCNYNVECILS